MPIDTIQHIIHANAYIIAGDTLSGAEMYALHLGNLAREVSNHEWWGAWSIGAVFGWTYSFINSKTNNDNLNKDYLVSTITCLIGAAILTYFGNNYELLGGYGIGLGFGFFVYVLYYYSMSKKSNDNKPIFIK